MKYLLLKHFLLYNWFYFENIKMCDSTNTESTSETTLEKNKEDNVEIKESNETQPLSKRALKRKLKHEKWLQWKPIKRAKEREKLRLKKQHARENNISLGPSRKALKQFKMANSSNKLRVCIDFAFDHLMSQKDISKCVKQLNRCYSLNRRAQHPLQFYVSNFKDKCREEIDRYDGYKHWDVHIHSESYTDIFKKEELVYLTSDSNNTIQDLDVNKVYIIGGIVDHNFHKNLTLNIANEQNIQHAKLPIDTYINMKTRQVLAINHVFEILVSISSEKLSWKDALLKTLPERKNIVPKQIKNKEDKEMEENCSNVQNNEDDQEESEERENKSQNNEGDQEESEDNEDNKEERNVETGLDIKEKIETES